MSTFNKSWRYTSLLNEKKQPRVKITEVEKDQLQEKFLIEYRKPAMSINNACKVIGFTRQHVYKWANTDSEFAKEFEYLRATKRKGGEKKWRERREFDEENKKRFLELYALPQHTLQSALASTSNILIAHDLRYWQQTDFEFKKEFKRLQYMHRPRAKKGSELVSIIGSAKLQARKAEFLEIYRQKLFSMTKACTAMGVQRCAVAEWKNKDPDFKLALESIEEEKMDFIEDALFNEIDNRNIAAIIFAAKCKLKERGYIEQPQQKTLSVEHTHKFDQDQLDAIVRGQQMDRLKYRKILELNEPKEITIEAEMIESETVVETENGCI